jgi:protein phosphatase
VGDSRLYERRDGTLRLLTRDDSWLEKLAETADIELSEAEQHPMRHLLTSVVGARPEVDATVDEIVLADQQLLLLCTDGLHGAIPEDTIRSVLDNASDLERAAEALVHTALERDGKDNITALLARYTAE